MTKPTGLTLTADSSFYDNTKVSSYKNCPRSYYLRHVLGWRSEGTSLPLNFGLGWHEGMSAMWKAARDGVRLPDLPSIAHEAFSRSWLEAGLPETPPMDDKRYDARNPMVAKEMYHNYAGLRYNLMRDCKLLADEQPFAVPVPGMKDTFYVGRMDKVIEYEVTAVIEHKTTSEYKIDGGFKESYIQSWASDSQTKGYEFAGNLWYNKDIQVWVDAALVHKKVHDAFKLIPVFHNPELIEEWLLHMKNWVQRIKDESDWPKNENYCHGKYGSCPFLDICRSVPKPWELDGPPPGYVEEKWEPFDVLGLSKLLEAERHE